MRQKRDRKSQAVVNTKMELAALKGTSSVGSEACNAREEVQSEQDEESVKDLGSAQSIEVGLLFQLLALHYCSHLARNAAPCSAFDLCPCQHA